MPSKLLALDMDGVLVQPWNGLLYSYTPLVLDYLLHQGHTLIVASFNPHARSKLYDLEIADKFHAIHAADCDLKSEMILQHLCGRDLSDVVFFDDTNCNITEVRKCGITAIPVFDVYGLTMELVRSLGL